MGLARGGPPPLADIDLWRLRHNPADPARWTEVRLLDGPDWLLIHYVPGVGGMPHLDANCRWCANPPELHPPRSLAFFPVLRIKTEAGRRVWGRSVLELPNDVAAMVPAPARAQSIDIMRLANRKYQLRVRDDDPGLVAQTLPRSFDVVEVLLRYWGLTRDDLEGREQVDRPDVVPFRKEAAG